MYLISVFPSHISIFRPYLHIVHLRLGFNKNTSFSLFLNFVMWSLYCIHLLRSSISKVYILRRLRRRLTLTRSASTCRWTRRNTRRLTGYLQKYLSPLKIYHCIFKTGPATSTLQGRSSTRARPSAMPTLRSSSSASMRLKVNFFLACIESSPYILVDNEPVNITVAKGEWMHIWNIFSLLRIYRRHGICSHQNYCPGQTRDSCESIIFSR